MLKRVLHATNQVVTHEEIHTGKELAIESTVNAPAEVRVKGDSWQRSTTGAQLLDVAGNMKDYEIGNFKWTINQDGSITARGSTGEGQYAVLNGYHMSLPVGSYTLSAISASNIRTIFKKKVDGAITYYISSGNAVNFEIDGTEEEMYFYTQVQPNTTVDETIYPMLNAGSTALPWEPYTGNVPSPSTEYPQDIISTSGILKSTNNSLGGRDKLRESQITVPELRAIPGTDVRDELVVYEDGTGKIVRRVKNVIYDNEKSIASLDSVGKLFKLGGEILSNHNQLHGMCCCDKFISKGLQVARSSDYAITSYGNYLYIRNKDLTTVEEAKAWIVNNPITVFAPLVTPTEEPLTAAEVQGFLRTHQYHTEIGFEGLDEHLEPEVEVKCRVLGR